jgi:hypothetical protein
VLHSRLANLQRSVAALLSGAARIQQRGGGAASLHHLATVGHAPVSLAAFDLRAAPLQQPAALLRRRRRRRSRRQQRRVPDAAPVTQARLRGSNLSSLRIARLRRLARI